MNKKFSTLVASLLLSSAFSVYAGNAKPMLATPTQVETRATSADVEEAVDYSGVITAPNNTAGRILKGFTNNSLIALSTTGNSNLLRGKSTGNDVTFAEYTNNADEFAYYYWRLEGGRLLNNKGQVFTIGTSSDYFEVIPLKIDGEVSSYFVLGQRDAAGTLKYVGSNLTLVSDLNDAYKLCSVETAYSDAYKGLDLDKELGNGFNLTISSKVDPSVTVVNADVFGGRLIASDNIAGSEFYTLTNENGDFIVFDTKAEVTSDGHSVPGKFKTVKSVGDDHLSLFRIAKADNDSKDILVEISNKAVTKRYRLYIANAAGTYALTVAETTDNSEDWAATVLGIDNNVDLREFLTGQYYTIDYVKKNGTATADDVYKTGGRLALLNNKADYVPVKSLYEKAPEAQWAVSGTVTEGVNDGKPYFNNEITLKNRENPNVSFKIIQLRRDNGAFIATIADETPTDNTGIDTNDVIKITAVAEHDKHDGYKVFNAEELKNTTWYLGQARQTADGDINVYWAENHAGSHQIGATVEEEKASKWNLSVVKKELAKHENETDSVLVVSTLNKWNSAKSRIDAVQDTLVILPYAFQNRSNSEFVKFNSATNLNYYECREYNLGDDKVYDKTNDARFALKMKADGTYNFVAVDANTYEGKDDASVVVKNNGIATKKVFQENSALLGTWSQMDMYAKDANSLMFVTEVSAPEYRKLVSEVGVDTVKIYRAENEAQVVYEKRDAKSVVEGRTLSFLNIDNDVQFSEINPALYVDTAYVNRGNNTRYQYLLGVNVTEHKGFYCPEHGFATERPCEHAEEVIYKTGRYLINMIDTANIMAADLKVSIHNNPYINETEEGNYCAKLSFVDAIHVLKEVSGKEGYADQLYVINNGDTTALDMSTPDFNVAKFAFKYVDSMNSDEFKIQTLYMPYVPEEYATGHDEDPLKNVTEEGYLRWVNGCVVVDNGYAKGDVFNMDENETRTPTANEEISAEGASVVVAGTNGAVVVKGAEGKNVIVSTILGKVVANEVLTSDNAQITAPAGVVVVSVDGESFKVVVK